MSELKLYAYYRSSCSYRVRMALNFKGLSYKVIPVNLLKGEHRQKSYTQGSPQGLVPTLIDGNLRISQSMAIIEYLEEKYRQHSLLPGNSANRALIRTISNVIACDTQPLQNLQVLKKLEDIGHNKNDKIEWNRHFIARGLRAVEAYLRTCSGTFSVGGTPTLADICLLPQIYNARRFAVNMQEFPQIERVEKNLSLVSAFAKAHPSQQIDTPKA